MFDGGAPGDDRLDPQAPEWNGALATADSSNDDL